jgi:hypothetical protein
MPCTDQDLRRLAKSQHEQEIAATQTIHAALAPLPPDARVRVMGAVCVLLCVDANDVEARMKKAGAA